MRAKGSALHVKLPGSTLLGKWGAALLLVRVGLLTESLLLTGNRLDMP